MKMIPDNTGKLPLRPHYDTTELDQLCEEIITSFMQKLHGKTSYPISTDDLTKLIEEDAEDLDLFADLSNYGEDVEGLTSFIPMGKPYVKIAATLSENPRYHNRYRTTLTHEYGHVKFHSPLWNQTRTMNMFSEYSAVDSTSCKRDAMQAERNNDWMEWQAGYICGAILMPRTAVRDIVRSFISIHGDAVPFFANSQNAHHLQMLITENFIVSSEAAKIRLLKLNYITSNPSNPRLIR